MATPLEGTASAFQLKKVNYTHDDIIGALIMEPSVTQRELSERYGYSETWISQVMGSDAFQMRLAERKTELVDPVIISGIEDRLRGLANLSLNVITEKLEAGRNVDLAVKGLEIATKALGFGAREKNISVQQNFVVQVPPKSASVDDWAKTYSGVSRTISEEG